MKKSTLIKGVAVALVLTPALAFAQTGFMTTLRQIIEDFAGLINALIFIAFSLAIIAFFWGIARYIWSAGDASKASEGRNIMIYGAIAIAVMASVFGITRVLQTTFGVSPGDNTIQPPRINRP